MNSPKPTLMADPSPLEWQLHSPPQPTETLQVPHKAEEDAILAEAARGEFGRFEYLYLKYSHLLWSCLVANYSGIDHDAACQDAWLKAISAIKNYQPGTNFPAWLMKIAARNAIDQRRRVKKDRPLMFDVDSEVDDGLNSLVHQEESAVLARCYNELKASRPDLADVVDKRLNGSSNQEIAKLAGVTPATATRRYQKALELLQNCVEGRPS